jgi:muramoyltetrapeptide carboxypeptidase
MTRDIGKERTVRVISPSGPCYKSEVLKSKEFLEGIGFEVQLGRNVFKSSKYLAGSDDARLSDAVAALEDSAVDIIWFSRGGYGSMRLLEKLPAYSLKKEKTMIGYSDATALFCWASRFPELKLLYGPSFSEVHDRSLADHSSLWASINNDSFALAGKASAPCAAEFQIVGGCLSILSSLAGTPFFPELENRFLFLEDVNEPMYRIDRMFTHLALSKAFEQAEGIILGSYKNIDGGTASEIFKRAVDLTGGRKPVVTGIKAGHSGNKRTLPFNRDASWDGRFLKFS